MKLMVRVSLCILLLGIAVYVVKRCNKNRIGRNFIELI